MGCELRRQHAAAESQRAARQQRPTLRRDPNGVLKNQTVCAAVLLVKKMLDIPQVGGAGGSAFLVVRGKHVPHRSLHHNKLRRIDVATAMVIAKRQLGVLARSSADGVGSLPKTKGIHRLV